jgi:dissimilatory sulfite reductase (desulfoviridin) alpha/beta subunit
VRMGWGGVLKMTMTTKRRDGVLSMEMKRRMDKKWMVGWRITVGGVTGRNRIVGVSWNENVSVPI